MCRVVAFLILVLVPAGVLAGTWDYRGLFGDGGGGPIDTSVTGGSLDGDKILRLNSDGQVEAPLDPDNTFPIAQVDDLAEQLLVRATTTVTTSDPNGTVPCVQADVGIKYVVEVSDTTPPYSVVTLWLCAEPDTDDNTQDGTWVPITPNREILRYNVASSSQPAANTSCLSVFPLTTLNTSNCEANTYSSAREFALDRPVIVESVACIRTGSNGWDSGDSVSLTLESLTGAASGNSTPVSDTTVTINESDAIGTWKSVTSGATVSALGLRMVVSAVTDTSTAIQAGFLCNVRVVGL